MNSRDLIRVIMEQQGVSNAALARQLGLTSAALWDRLNTKKNKSLSVANVSEMLEPLGYRLVIIPAGSQPPEGSFPVDPEDRIEE